MLVPCNDRPVEGLHPTECSIRYLHMDRSPSRIVVYLPARWCPKTFDNEFEFCPLWSSYNSFEGTKHYDQWLQGGGGAAMTRLFGQRGSRGFVWASLAALLVGGPASADRDVEAAFAQAARVHFVRAGSNAKVALADPDARVFSDPGLAAAFAEPDARDADLIEAIAEQNDRPARIHPVQPAIAVMRDGWHHGRIVIEADILQDRNRPLGDGKTRRTIAADRPAGQIFQVLLRAQHVRPEFIGLERVDELVGVSMRSDLMARRGDLAYQPRTFLGDPAEKQRADQLS